MSDIGSLLRRARPASIKAPFHKLNLEETLREKIRNEPPRALSLGTYATLWAACALLLMLFASLPQEEIRIVRPEHDMIPGLPQVYAPTSHGMIQISWSERKAAPTPGMTTHPHFGRLDWETELR